MFIYNFFEALTGGPLQHNYRLAQFHCHWGKDCSAGSEHTVNGKSYAAEVRIFLWIHGFT